MLEITFLGTGTSQGVPVIGCYCEVCRSTDPRDHRLRTAAMVRTDQGCLVIDAGPDFRQQMLRADSPPVDAIVLTHEHNDHVIGLDDVRPYNFMRGRDMPIYCTAQVAQEVQHRFAYAFTTQPYPGAPRLQLHHIRADQPFVVQGTLITPIQLYHAQLPVLGFRIGDLTYMTDTKTISEAELEKVRGTHTLVLNALHHQQHHSHLNLQEALALVARIQPQQTYLVHMSHHMGLHSAVEQQLPPNVYLAYDGLQVSFS